jgi:hypothetical protein
MESFSADSAALFVGRLKENGAPSFVKRPAQVATLSSLFLPWERSAPSPERTEST